MTDLLREVDEAMRVEKMTRFWQENGNTIIAAIVAIVLGTALSSGWQAYKHQKHMAETSALLSALEQDNPQASLDALGKSAKGNAKAFALLNAATLALDKKDTAAALSDYTAITADKYIDPLFRDLATVQSVSITLDTQKEAKADDLIATLAPIVANAKSPWQPRATLLSALIKAHKKNDYPAAIKDLDTIAANQDAPQSLKARAAALREVYNLKVTK